MRIIQIAFVLLVSFALFAQNPPSGEGASGDRNNQENNDDKNKKKEVVFKNTVVLKEHAVSTNRIASLKKLIDTEFYDKNENVKDAEVVKIIYGDVGKRLKINVMPKTRPDSRDMTAIRESVRTDVLKKFPDSEKDILKKAYAKAETLYPLTKRGDTVKVIYVKSRRVYSLSGKFYGFGVGNKSIQINSRYIPVVDLTPESLVRFDETINNRKKEEYARGVLSKYIRDRFDYETKLAKAAQTVQRIANEKNGFIFYVTPALNNGRGGWTSAKIVIDDYMKEVVVRYNERERRKALERERKEREDKEKKGSDQTQQEQPEAPLDQPL